MKNLFKGLVFAAAMCFAMNAAADSFKIFIPDFAIAPGQTKKVGLAMTNDFDIKDWQARMVLPAGVTLVKTTWYDEDEEEDMSEWVQPTGYATKKNVGLNVVVKTQDDGTTWINMLSATMQTGSSANKYKAGEAQVFGYITITASADYDAKAVSSAKIWDDFTLKATYLKDDNSQVDVYGTDSEYPIYPAKTIAWLNENAGQGGVYGVADPAVVVAKFNNEVVVENAAHEWMQYKVDDASAYTVGQTIEIASVFGELSTTSDNPAITTTCTPEASSETVEAAVEKDDLSEHFAPVSNAVVEFKGYYNATKNAICAYAPSNTDQGQCIAVEFEATNAPGVEAAPATLTDGAVCKVQAIMQYKYAWSDAKATGDEYVTSRESLGAWKNYVAQVVSVDTQTVTGINDINTNSNANVRKYIENGQVVIERNGVKYNVMGAQMK